MDKNQSIVIKFEGSSHQVDANTLINVLIHYQNIINIANVQYGNGEKEIKMQVNAIEKGSFVINIGLKALKTLFSKDVISYISDLKSVVGGVFHLYKLCKGKKIKIDDLRKNDDGSISILVDNRTYIYNADTIKIYNHKETREAISKSIETAREDDNVEGLTVITDQPTTFDRAEFSDYIYTDFDKEEDLPLERQIDVDAVIVITALSFEKGYKWRFVYNGFPISMIIKDDALMEAIDKGERFGKGDALDVKLRITQKFDNDYKAYVNVSYKIIEYHKHIDISRQADIDFPQA